MIDMKTPKRFIFTLPMEVFYQARKHAFERNISISKYILEALLWRIHQDEKCQ